MDLPSLDSTDVFSRAVALADGISDDALAQRCARGELVRIRPGTCAVAERWATMYAEQRALWSAAAFLDAARGGRIVFSHTTAAAIHGLPLVRTDPTTVHVIVAGDARSTARVRRHRTDIDSDDVLVSADGSFAVTSLARTLVDLARSADRPTSLSATDAALRKVALRGGRELELAAAERLRAEIVARIDAAPGGRGVRGARFIVGFADARAELPGESISRLYLHLLGFPPPGLQTRVPGPAGRTYEIDFDLGTAWGEFDGAGKYTDARFLRGRTPERALADEKEREDWIRGTTRRPMIRWQFRHLASPSTLGTHLAAFGLHAPRRRPFRE